MDRTFAYFGPEWGMLACFTVFGIPTVLFLIFWILDHLGFLPRRPPPGRCSQCNYDLTGNRSGVCSECGRAIRAENR